MKYLFYIILINFYFITVFLIFLTIISLIKENIFFVFIKKKLFLIISAWSLLYLIKNINKNVDIDRNDNIYLNDFILYIIKNFKEEKVSMILSFFIIFIFFKKKIFYVILIQSFITLLATLFLFSYINAKRELKENFEINLKVKNIKKWENLRIYILEIPKTRAFLINYLLLSNNEDIIKKKQTKKILKRIFYYNIINIPYYAIKISIELNKIIKMVLNQCNWKEKYKISWIYIFIYEFNKILLYKLKEEFNNTKFLISNMKISNKGTNNYIISETTPIIIAKTYQKNKLIWNLKEIYTPTKHCGMVQVTKELSNQLVYSKTHSKSLNGVEGSCKTILNDKSIQYTHQIIISKEKISELNCWSNFLKNNYVENYKYSEIALFTKNISTFYLINKPYIYHDIKKDNKQLINLNESDLKHIKLNKLTEIIIFEDKPEMDEFIEKLIEKRYKIKDKIEIEIIKKSIAKYIEEMNEKDIWDNILKGSDLMGFEDDLIEIERFKNKTDIF